MTPLLLTTFLFLAPLPPPEAEIKSLMEAVKALEFQGLKLNDRRRRKIAIGAYLAGQQTNVDPYLLIAIARMESDFMARPMLHPRCFNYNNIKCVADCGITQHHVQGNVRWVRSYCKRLRTDHREAFLRSAKEIRWHVAYCKVRQNRRWYRPFLRCVLNRYNQGPFYLRSSMCKQRLTPLMSQAAKRRVLRRCYSRAAYWKKVLCFYHGAKNKIKLARSCRRCYNLRKIPWYYKMPMGNYQMPTIF